MVLLYRWHSSEIKGLCLMGVYFIKHKSFTSEGWSHIFVALDYLTYNKILFSVKSISRKFSWKWFHEIWFHEIFFGSDTHTYNKSVDQWWNNDIPSSLTNGTVTILSSSEASPPDDRVPQPDTCIWSPFWNSMPNSGKVTGAALLFQSPPKNIYTFYYFHLVSAFLKLISFCEIRIITQEQKLRARLFLICNHRIS